jgi:hypothetical protein
VLSFGVATDYSLHQLSAFRFDVAKNNAHKKLSESLKVFRRR